MNIEDIIQQLLNNERTALGRAITLVESTLHEHQVQAQENLSALVKTKERFQLEIAQNAIPWSLLSEPAMNPNPIAPSFRKNLFL